MSADLPATEGISEATAGLDQFSLPDLVTMLVDQHARAIDVLLGATPAIARAVDAIVARLESGGHLHYVGAGSSGRLGVLDAAECPPTFGTSPDFVQAHIAGDTAALTRAVEGAEDDADAGAQMMRRLVDARDAVVGISASGNAAYVVGALEEARERGALTVAIFNSPGAAIARHADFQILLETGAEAIAGSTRLRAGTAQKIVLNTVSTAVMVRLGKVYDNLMVDVVATNAKLRARALRLIRTLADCDDASAQHLLQEAGGSVKVAVVMRRRGIDADAARALLEQHRGFLRAALSA